MTLAAFMYGLKTGGSGLATTMAFATLCLSRLVHGYNCKADVPVIFTKRFFNNKYLQGAFLIGFVLLNAVLLIPGVQGLFQVTPLSITQLLMIYGFALLNLIIIQILKKLRNIKKA